MDRSKKQLETITESTDLSKIYSTMTERLLEYIKVKAQVGGLTMLTFISHYSSHFPEVLIFLSHNS